MTIKQTPSVTIVLAACAACVTTLPASATLPASEATPTRTVPRQTMIRVLTETELTVDYHQTPAREVFKHLHNTLGIPIIGRYSDDKAGHGIEPDTPITLDVRDTPALTVLRLVLDQCEDLDPCTWQLRRSYVEVGTKVRLSTAAAHEIRLYPIADLMMAVPDFDNAPGIDLSTALNQTQAGGGAGSGSGGGGFGGGGSGSGSGSGNNGGSIISTPGESPRRLEERQFAQDLMDLIYGTVEPEAWDTLGGEATIHYLSGTLIVRAPDFVHRGILGVYRVPGTHARSGRPTP